MPKSLRNNGLVLEYYSAQCENWTPTTRETPDGAHYHVEAAMEGNTEQLLKQTLPDTLPETCSACDGDVEEEYDVVVWAEGKRVKAHHARELLEVTNGYYQLRFDREDQPVSEVTDNHFEDTQKPLYVYWYNGTMFAATQTYLRDTGAVVITERDLDSLTTHYPVTAVTSENSPFDRYENPAKTKTA